jgi:type I restriction enzyme S subunit
LSDFAERVTRKNSNNETDLPLTISSKDGLVDQISYFNKTVASKDMSGYYLLRNGEYAYNKSYSVGYDFGSIKRLDRYPMGALSTLYICFALKKHDTDFIKVYFDSLKWYKEIYMISAEGARNHGLLNVPTDEFFATKHYLPENTAEQRKVADFLIALDRRIDAQQSLVVNLKKYKRGVFETVFSQKVRLIPRNKRKDWQKYKLSDFATRVTRKNGGQSDIPLTISAQYGLIDQRDFFSKTVASADMSGYYLLRSGEYAYNRSTSNDYPFGSIKRLELYPMGAVSTLYLCFRVKDDIVLSDLAKWYFESSQWHRGVNEICAEGARNHGLLNVPTDGFFNTVHTLPSDPEEQLAIASYLSLFQARLDSAQAVLEKLLRIRSGLMQRLFT